MVFLSEGLGVGGVQEHIFDVFRCGLLSELHSEDVVLNFVENLSKTCFGHSDYHFLKVVGTLHAFEDVARDVHLVPVLVGHSHVVAFDLLNVKVHSL